MSSLCFNVTVYSHIIWFLNATQWQTSSDRESLKNLPNSSEWNRPGTTGSDCGEGPLLGNPENDSWDDSSEVSVKVLWCWPKDHSYRNLLHTQTHPRAHTPRAAADWNAGKQIAQSNIWFFMQTKTETVLCVSLPLRLSVWHIASCFTIHFQFRFSFQWSHNNRKRREKKNRKNRNYYLAFTTVSVARAHTHTHAHAQTNLFSASFFSTHT